MSENQYGFTTKKSTVDAALTIKEFMEAHLNKKHYIALVSLAVRGAFDAAWWPSILYISVVFDVPKIFIT